MKGLTKSDEGDASGLRLGRAEGEPLLHSLLVGKFKGPSIATIRDTIVKKSSRCLARLDDRLSTEAGKSTGRRSL